MQLVREAAQPPNGEHRVLAHRRRDIGQERAHLGHQVEARLERAQHLLRTISLVSAAGCVLAHEGLACREGELGDLLSKLDARALKGGEGGQNHVLARAPDRVN